MDIIFLDFDGVITTEKSMWRFDPKKMDMIKELCETTGARIVITSSWRTYDLEKTLQRIIDREKKEGNLPYALAEYTVDITPRCGVTYTGLDSEVRHESCPRGKEIDVWLSQHGYWCPRLYDELKPNTGIIVENYVIFDDDCDMLLSQKDNFVKTDTYKGVSRKDINKAIKILTRNKNEN